MWEAEAEVGDAPACQDPREDQACGPGSQVCATLSHSVCVHWSWPRWEADTQTRPLSPRAGSLVPRWVQSCGVGDAAALHWDMQIAHLSWGGWVLPLPQVLEDSGVILS